eukprot:TRINITY_DN11871_c0_g1_i1.p1 TRINITY_DN11871_c0_g1~~TRINITY_DN11871_c0_g1_i1.p1  ORF type:complete len:1416 (-),score=300.06 TRINITY_DN11871_c0_g1_i1:104-4351(-)
MPSQKAAVSHSLEWRFILYLCFAICPLRVSCGSLLPALASSASSCHLYVGANGSDSPPCGLTSLAPCASLQMALSISGNAGLICLLPGLHTASVNITITGPNIPLSIIGLGDAASVIVDCQGNTSGWFFTQATASLRISNLTFSNCTAAEQPGAALFVVSAQQTVLIQDCVFDDNTLTDGDGAALYINVTAGNATVIGCTFTNNAVLTDATFSGGAMFVVNNAGLLTIAQCLFTANSVNSGYAGGALYIKNRLADSSGNGNADVQVTDCSFINNEAENVLLGGGALFIRNDNYGGGNTTALVSSCIFTGNSASGSELGGGAVYLSNDIYNNNVASDHANAFIALVNCTLTHNDASYAMGGAVYIDNQNANANTAAIGYFYQQAAVAVVGCVIADNTVSVSTYGGGGVYVFNSNLNLEGEAIVTVMDTLLTRNSAAAADGGGVSVNNYNSAFGLASVSVIRCVLSHNNCSSGTDSYGGGGGMYILNNANIVAQTLVLVMNCTFAWNSVAASGPVDFDASTGGTNMSPQASGGGDVFVDQVTAESSVVLANCGFSNGSAVSGGSLYLIGPSTVTMQLCAVQDSSADSSGGAIFASNGVQLSISNCSLARNSASYGAGLFAQSSSVLVTNATLFVANTAGRVGGAVLLQGSFGVFTDVMVCECTAADGGGGLAVYFAGAALINCTFQYNSAYLGGALLSSSSGHVVATASAFLNNSAVLHGGVAYVFSEARFFACIFTGNNAASGGAFYMETAITSYGSQSVLLAAQNCTFSDNRAIQGGGCIFWTGAGLEPLCTDCVYAASNQAAYGRYNATPPIELTVTVASIAALTNSSVIAVHARLLDWYAQPVVLVPAPSVVAIGNDAQVQGSGLLPAGYATFNVSVRGLNTLQSLQFQALTLQSTPVTIQIGQCAPGFGYSDNICALCAAGAYTLNTSLPCGACTTNIICNGGTDTAVSSTYWPNIHVPSGRVQAMLCPFDFCTHNSTSAAAGNLFVPQTWCNPLAHRDPLTPLCGGCLPGYSEWSHECVPCNGPHAGAVVLQLLQLLVIVLLQRVLSQTGGGTSGFVMLVFVYQYAQFALYPKPLLQSLLKIFSLQLPAASGLGCPFPANGYGQLAVQLCVPLLCVAILGLLFMCHHCAARLLQRFSVSGWHAAVAKSALFVIVTSGKGAYIRTLIVLCLNLYETVLEAAFSFLVCVTGQYNQVNVVYLYPSVSCETTQYAATRVAMSVIIALFVALPVVIVVLLSRQRKRRHSLHHLRDRYGRLFGDYRERYYWWGCLLLWRRAILLTAFVPLAGQVSLAAAKAAMLACVLVFLIIQVMVLPYADPVDNKLETVTLVALAGVIGLSSSDSLDDLLHAVLVGALLVACGLILVAPSVRASVLKVVAAIRKRTAKASEPVTQPGSIWSDASDANATLLQPLL